MQIVPDSESRPKKLPGKAILIHLSTNKGNPTQKPLPTCSHWTHEMWLVPTEMYTVSVKCTLHSKELIWKKNVMYRVILKYQSYIEILFWKVKYIKIIFTYLLLLMWANRFLIIYVACIIFLWGHANLNPLLPKWHTQFQLSKLLQLIFI